MTEEQVAERQKQIARARDAANDRADAIIADCRERGVRDGNLRAIRESMVRGAIALVDGGYLDPAGAISEAPEYDPFVEAYKPWPDTNLAVHLQNAISAGKAGTATIHTIAADGVREALELGPADAARYALATFPEQAAMRTSKIRERRLTTAIDAAARLHKSGRGKVFALSESGIDAIPAVTPDEEMCLRQFGALDITRRRAVESVAGGATSVSLVDDEARIREGWSPRARAALRAREQDLDPVRLCEAWGSDFYGGGPETTERIAVAGFGCGDGFERREFLRQYGPNQIAMQLSDVWDELAKAQHTFETDPMAKSAIRIKSNFPLGRGLSVVCTDKRVQAVIDEFDVRHPIQLKKAWLRTALVSGELFMRKVPLGDGRLRAMSLPARTIWWVLTPAEDPSTALGFVQRYYTQYQPFANAANAFNYVDRLISADECIHYKVNADLGEVRGRSDLYAALPWHLKFRHLWDAEIEKAYAAAAWMHIATVDGDQRAIDAFTARVIPRGRPKPGTVIVVNAQVKEFKTLTADKVQPAGMGSANDGILNAIAACYGFAKEYLGVTGSRTRGGQVISDGPAQKTFEDVQDDFSGFLAQVYDAVIDEAIAKGELPEGVDRTVNIGFPDIIKADSQPKVEMAVVGRSQGFVSHRTAAGLWASAMDLPDFDYDAEQTQIEKEQELGIGLPPPPASFNDQVDPKGAAPGDNHQQPQGGTDPRQQDDPRGQTGSGKVRADDQTAEESEMDVETAMRVLQEAGCLIVEPGG